MHISQFAESESDIRRSVNIAVRRKMMMLCAFRDMDRESLVQDMMGEVEAAWPRFNPNLSSPGTFAYQVASRRLIDVWRARSNEARRMSAFAIDPEIGVPDTHTDIFDGWEKGQPIEEWIESIYRSARKAFGPKYRRQGRKFYNHAQLVAVGALQVRLKASSRGLALYIQNHPEVRNALRMRSSPSWRTIARCTHAVNEIAGQSLAFRDFMSRCGRGRPRLPLRITSRNEHSERSKSIRLNRDS